MEVLDPPPGSNGAEWKIWESACLESETDHSTSEEAEVEA